MHTEKKGYTLLEMAIAVTILTVAAAMLSVGIQMMTEQSKVIAEFSLTAKSKMLVLSRMEAAATGIIKEPDGTYRVELSADKRTLTVEKNNGPLMLELNKMRGLEQGQFEIDQGRIGYTSGGESYWVPIVAEY